MCNFSHDNTISRCDSNLEFVLEDLQHDMKILLNCFKINSVNPNPKNLQFMFFGKSSRLLVILNINNIKIRESQKVISLGLTIHNCFTFKDHIDTLCCNASYKLHAWQNFYSNAFVNSQFS